MFTETASGARPDRPTLEQLLDQLRPGDTLVVWKLDRLGRSLRHLVDTITSLADRGVGFRSLQEAIDTTTPGGKLVFHVFAALAEFERDLIRERITAGLAAARTRGRHGGRPSVMTTDKLQVAREMYVSGQYSDPLHAIYGPAVSSRPNTAVELRGLPVRWIPWLTVSDRSVAAQYGPATIRPWRFGPSGPVIPVGSCNRMMPWAVPSAYGKRSEDWTAFGSYMMIAHLLADEGGLI